MLALSIAAVALLDAGGDATAERADIQVASTGEAVRLGPAPPLTIAEQIGAAAGTVGTSSTVATTTTTTTTTTTSPTSAAATTATAPDRTTTTTTAPPRTTTTAPPPTTTAPPTTTTTAPPTTTTTTTTTTAPPQQTDASGDPEGAGDGYAYDDPRSTQVWYDLADCEAWGDWSLNTGNGYYGGLQFSKGTWDSVGGTGYPHEHPAEIQIEMGRRLHAEQGWYPWPHCARELGLIE